MSWNNSTEAGNVDKLSPKFKCVEPEDSMRKKTKYTSTLLGKKNQVNVENKVFDSTVDVPLMSSLCEAKTIGSEQILRK